MARRHASTRLVLAGGVPLLLVLLPDPARATHGGGPFVSHPDCGGEIFAMPGTRHPLEPVAITNTTAEDIATIGIVRPTFLEPDPFPSDGIDGYLGFQGGVTPPGTTRLGFGLAIFVPADAPVIRDTWVIDFFSGGIDLTSGDLDAAIHVDRCEVVVNVIGPSAPGQTVALTLWITELVQLDEDFDGGFLSPFPSLGDFFARLHSLESRPEDEILRGLQDNFDGRCNPSIVLTPSDRSVVFTEGFALPGCPDTPWRFDFDVWVGSLVFGRRLSVEIEIFDADDRRFGNHDRADLDPGGDEKLHLTIPLDGRWGGDLAWPRRCNHGPDRPWFELTQAERDALPSGGRAVRVCWEVEVEPDSDGDGLLDSWEIDGFDADGDGVDVDLRSLGADPMHKDLFVELDWETGAPPAKEAIDEVKAAFATAPQGAGGVENPDGRDGINLWVDTGGLRDASGELVGDDLGGGNELPVGQWHFGKTCIGGVSNGNACAGDAECDLDAPGDGLGTCAVGYDHAKALYFDRSRALLFRYAVVNDQAGGGQARAVGEPDFWIYGRPVPDVPYQAYTLMHELGHTLNLSHGGRPEDHGVRNCEPNYLSIMNYRHSRLVRVDGSTHLDFAPAKLRNGKHARAPLGELEEFSLDEGDPLDPTDADHVVSFVGPPEVCVALCAGGKRDGARCASDVDCPADPSKGLPAGACAGTTEAAQACTEDDECGGGRCSGRDKTQPIGDPIDWDLQEPFVSDLTQNIDGYFLPGNCGNEKFAAEITRLPESSLTAYDDWSNLRLPIWLSSGSSSGLAAPEPELTEEEFEAGLESVNTTDLVLAKTGPPGPIEVPAHVRLEYALDLANVGDQLAGAVEVVDVLPAGLRAVGIDERCGADAEGASVVCRVEAFTRGQETRLELVAEGELRCEGGLPAAVENVATAANASEFAGADPVPGDNRAVWRTATQDTTPPSLSVSVTPSVLWPPDHTFVTIEAALEVADACDAAPSVRLVEIRSDEPGEGRGDGATSEDVQGASVGSDDRSFELRAERSGGGSDRVYTIVYEATDASGNRTRGEATVTVPHDQSRGGDERPGSACGLGFEAGLVLLVAAGLRRRRTRVR